MRPDREYQIILINDRFETAVRQWRVQMRRARISRRDVSVFKHCEALQWAALLTELGGAVEMPADLLAYAAEKDRHNAIIGAGIAA